MKKCVQMGPPWVVYDDFSESLRALHLEVVVVLNSSGISDPDRDRAEDHDVDEDEEEEHAKKGNETGSRWQPRGGR